MKTNVNPGILALFVAILAQSCFSPDRGTASKGGINSESSVFGKSPSGSLHSGTDCARGFSIETFSGFRILNVKDPWQGSSGIHFKYVLSSDLDEIPDSLMHLPAIQTPVSRVICMSTTHVAMIHSLGKTESIVGISGVDYISNQDIRTRIKNGESMDVGADQSLNYERIVSLKPDVLISYGVTAEISGMVKRLGDLGIPVVLNGDYLENEPLGKTEWLKFMAAFFEMGNEADSIFESISAEYEKYREMANNAVAGTVSRPSVLTGLPWNDAWYIPGGKSFAAAFIEDAGADFLWKDMDSHEAAPVSLESVFSRAMNADFWINSGSALSLEDIRKTEARLVKLGPFKKSTIYNNTAQLNPSGGNDFWETGVMEPQLILADLINIFYPGLVPGHKMKYYEQLH